MSKSKLLVGVCICGVVFSGCGFFSDLFGLNDKKDTITKKLVCHTQDLKERLDSYYSSDKYHREDIADFTNEMAGFFKDSDNNKCDEWILAHYNEVVKAKQKMPTNFIFEIHFTDEWVTCNVMPKWLNTKLNEYIKQNKNDDKAFIEASKFKEKWEATNRFNGKAKYYDYWVFNGKYTFDYKVYEEQTSNYTYRDWTKQRPSLAERQMSCKSIKIAQNAIENDLINLGNGKKAKCADLSYKDAPKCLEYFDDIYVATYKKAKDEYDIKQERKKYEKKNKNL